MFVKVWTSRKICMLQFELAIVFFFINFDQDKKHRNEQWAKNDP